jgi:hypothetical protein
MITSVFIHEDLAAIDVNRPKAIGRGAGMPSAKLIQKPKTAQGSMAMKMSFPILLLIVGSMSGSHASTVDSPSTAVRVQRAESNAAIEASRCCSFAQTI